MYIPVLAYASVRDILSPYESATLSPPWKQYFPDAAKISAFLLDETRKARLKTDSALAYHHARCPAPWSVASIFPLFKPAAPDECPYAPIFSPVLLDSFETFVKEKKEGALVILLLLLSFRSPRMWVGDRWSGPYQGNGEQVWWYGYLKLEYKAYPRFHMLRWKIIFGGNIYSGPDIDAHPYLRLRVNSCV